MKQCVNGFLKSFKRLRGINYPSLSLRAILERKAKCFTVVLAKVLRVSHYASLSSVRKAAVGVLRTLYPSEMDFSPAGMDTEGKDNGIRVLTCN